MILPTLDFEKDLWNKGFKFVCGVDEVGRGSFAGPVVVGAVIFSPDSKIPQGINDSKLLSAKKRQELDLQIRENCLFWAISEIGLDVINELGIGKATQAAFLKVIESLKQKPDFILIDAFYIDGLDKNKQKPIIRGDRLSVSIAAASIIAKVYRDKLMDEMDTKYTQYGFAKNKGYGTKAHRDAIKKYGLSDMHRKSFNLSRFT